MSLSLQNLDNHLLESAAAIRDAIDPEEAETIAKEIVDRFEDHVDADYRGWETNQQTVQRVERILLSVLLQDNDLGHLLTEADSLTDDIRRYLIQNHG